MDVRPVDLAVLVIGSLFMAIGVAAGAAAFSARPDVAFEPGDCLLVYTDGLTEAVRPKGDEFFGDAELARVLTHTPTSDNMIRRMLHAHQRWIGEDAPVADDVCVLMIERVKQALPNAIPAAGT